MSVTTWAEFWDQVFDIEGMAEFLYGMILIIVGLIIGEDPFDGFL